jgi:diguanylate cyclase (GGDEF)-like protein
MNLAEFLDRQPKPFLFGLGVSFVIFLGIIDYVTGKEIAFSVFYLLPISMVTWFLGKRIGALVSAASAISGLEAELISGSLYSSPIISYWNTLITFGFYVFVVIILSELKKNMAKETELSRTDPLTGLSNRRYFFEVANNELERFNKHYHPITVAYIDLDNFKSVNDTMGHDIGDELLRTVSYNISSHLRKTDVVARLGGDEFAVMLPETGDVAAQDILHRLRYHLLSVMADKKWPVTFSIGVVTFCIPPDSVDEMVKKADNLMYSIKHSTKNMIKYEVIGEYQRLRNSVFHTTQS